MRLCVVLTCAAIPVFIAGASTAGGLAPLSMYRFTIASQTTLILIAGLLIAQIGGLRLKAICALIVTVIALAQSATATSLMRGAGLVHQRVECWKSVIGEVNKTAGDPVFVFPNLVEDARFAANPTQQLREYYRFPITSLYPLNVSADRLVEGCPIPDWQGFTSGQLREIKRRGKAWLIIRATEPDAEFICEQIAEQAKQHGATVVFEDFSSEPLYLIRAVWHDH